jgi:hypothetical protein
MRLEKVATIKKIALVTCFLMLSYGLVTIGQEKQQTHPDTCPKDCKICKEAIDKGIDYIVKTSSGVCELSMCGLVLLASGANLDDGKYSKKLKGVLEFILGKSRKDGMISEHDSHGIEVTALAVIFLSEIYKRKEDPKVKEVILKAVKYFEKNQEKRKRNGWNYADDERNSSLGILPADASIAGTTYTVLGALLSAKSAGIEVPEKAISKGIDSLIYCISENGAIGYCDTPGGLKDITSKLSYARAGGALYALERAGRQEENKTKKLRDHFLNNIDKVHMCVKSSDYDPHFRHALLFATMGLYQIGGKTWKSNYTLLRDALLSSQLPNGSWRTGGQGYATFFYEVNLLMWQLPLGNLKTLK